MISDQQYTILNNNGNSSKPDETDPLLLSKNLISLIFKLKGLNWIDDKSIDYKSLSESDLYKNDFSDLIHQLPNVKLEKLIENTDNGLNDRNLLAFFINNNLLNQVDGKFWSIMAYKIGGFTFSLDDIEHGILRSNRLHPTKNVQFFSPEDPRLKFCVKGFDPRIHFALNCGAKGCPPISFYTPENVQRGLSLASTNFCTNETQVNEEEGKVVLSRLFLWYGSDFVQDLTHKNEEILEFVEKNLKDDDEIKFKYINLMKKKCEIKIEFSNYDWNINNKNI